MPKATPLRESSVLILCDLNSCQVRFRLLPNISKTRRITKCTEYWPCRCFFLPNLSGKERIYVHYRKPVAYCNLTGKRSGADRHLPSKNRIGIYVERRSRLLGQTFTRIISDRRHIKRQ